MNQSNLLKIFSELEELTSQIPFRYLDGNLVKQRFFDAPCPLDTAISKKSDEGLTYLHGNSVSMPDGNQYFAVQYPVYDSFTFFWDFIFENTELIIDLTEEGEVELVYHPKREGESNLYGDIQVSCILKESERVGIKDYTFEILEKCSQKKKSVKKIHVGTIMDQTGLDQGIFSYINHRIHDWKITSPILVHCKAGVGRTGTLITGRTMLNLLARGEVNKENMLKKLQDCILHGRRQRGPLFVQSPIQFVGLASLIHEHLTHDGF